MILILVLIGLGDIARCGLDGTEFMFMFFFFFFAVVGFGKKRGPNSSEK